MAVPAKNNNKNTSNSIGYKTSENLYPRYLHDLSFGLHAECLYFADGYYQDKSP
ncbi:hypothetical protein [Pseudomonas sp. Z2-11]